MKTTIVAAVAIVTTLLSGSPSIAQEAQADPWLGTWKLNLEKSKLGFAPKSEILRVESVAGGAQKYSFDIVDADGRTFHNERVTKFDGADVPVEGTQPKIPNVPEGKLTNSFRRIDSRTFEVTMKRDGTPTGIATITVSPDGRTLTQTRTDLKGQRLAYLTVFEKQ